MKKSIRLAALLGAVALVATACGDAPDENEGGDAASEFTACMVSDAGGIDDRSFNASAWQGLQDAESELGVTAKFVESKADTDYAPNINQLVAEDCGNIVTVGFLMGDATAEAAKANVDERFAIVDNTPDGDPATPDTIEPIDNVKPLLFDTAQAAYLAGYLAAGMTQSGVVGTFGGIKIPPVTVFMDGFADGIAKYNEVKGKQVKLLGWDKAAQNGTFTGDFDKQENGKREAETMITQGADIIFPVAGPVGLGAAAAAQATGGKVNLIWVDADGYETAPDYKSLFITSVLKQIGAATFAVTEETLNDEYSNEPYVGTLENEGVGLAPYHDFDSKVSDELKAEIDQLKADIIDGTIVVQSDASPKG